MTLQSAFSMWRNRKQGIRLALSDAQSGAHLDDIDGLARVIRRVNGQMRVLISQKQREDSIPSPLHGQLSLMTACISLHNRLPI